MGPTRPGEVLQFGAKHMRQTSVYVYKPNEVFFARLCERRNVRVKKDAAAPPKAAKDDAAPPEAVMSSPSFHRRRRKRKASSVPKGLEAIQEHAACQEAVLELPKLHALPLPPKLPVLLTRLKLLALPVPLKRLALLAPSLMQAPPLLPAKPLASPRPSAGIPVRVEPLWSVSSGPTLAILQGSCLAGAPLVSTYGPALASSLGFLLGWSLPGLSLRLHSGPLLLNCLSLPGSTLPYLPGPLMTLWASLLALAWLTSLPPLFVFVFWFF